jgi:hypothetical protein
VADSNFIVKNTLVVNTSFSANSTQLGLTSILVSNAATTTVSSSNLVAGNNSFTGTSYRGGNVVFAASAGLSANGTYGTNGQVLVTNGSAIYWGTGTAGLNTQVQFNDGGTANGTAGLTFSKTSNTLAISNTLTVGSFSVNSTSLTANGFTVTSSGGSFNGSIGGSSLNISGLSNTGTLAVVGGATVGGTLAVTGAATFSGNVTVTGNLVLAGTTTFVDSVSISTSDKLLILANGAISSATADGTGIVAGTYANLVYKSAGSSWQSNVNITPSANNLNLGNTSNLWNLFANTITGNGASITSVNAATVGGNTAATLRAYSDTAYSNASAEATTKSNAAYSNAVSVASSDAITKAGTAYTNAVSVAASDATTKAGTAYTNAISVAASDATTKAGTAYSNAISYITSNTIRFANSTNGFGINGAAASATTATTATYLSTTAQTNQINFQAGQSSGGLQNATGGLGGIMVQAGGGANAAFMTFHRPGNFAAYFGIDTDNQFAVGGWSSGAGLSYFKCLGLGVGTAAIGGGTIAATGDIYSAYSDERLKTKLGPITDALTKVKTLNGFFYQPNDTALALGFNDKIEKRVGVSAQEIQAVLPEAVHPAPKNNEYLTVQYEKIVPLLIEAIKELSNKLDAKCAGCSCGGK